MVFELHQSKHKWLLLWIFNSTTFSKWYWIFKYSIFIHRLLLKNYGSILAIGDFNFSVDKSHLEANDHSSLAMKPTCYQSMPSFTDLILTNRKNFFKLPNIFETGLSDLHNLVCTILKSGGFKGEPIEKIYRSYKTFEVNNFKTSWNLKSRK